MLEHPLLCVNDSSGARTEEEWLIIAERALLERAPCTTLELKYNVARSYLQINYTNPSL